MKKNRLILVPLISMLLVLIAMLVFELVPAFTRFRPTRSLFAGDFVEFDNFSQLFNGSNFFPAMIRSLLEQAVTIVPAMLLSLVLATIIGLLPSRSAKTLVAGAALMTAFIPAGFWFSMIRYIFGTEMLFSKEGQLLFLGLMSLLPRTGLFVFAGLSLNLSREARGHSGVLLACCLPCLTLFMPDLRDMLIIQNPYSAESLSMLSRSLLISSSSYSISAAAAATGRLLCLFTGIPFMLLMGSIMRPTAPELSCDGTTPRPMRESLTGLLGALLIGLIATLPVLSQLGAIAYATDALSVTLILAGVTVAVVFVLLFFLMVTTWNAPSTSSLPHGLFAMLLAMLCMFTPAALILLSSLKLINTVFALMLGALSHPAFLAVVVLLVAVRPTSMRQAVMLALGGALLAASCAVTDTLPFDMGYALKPDMHTFSYRILFDKIFSTQYMPASSVGGELPPPPELVTMLGQILPAIALSIPGAALLCGGIGGPRGE